MMRRDQVRTSGRGRNGTIKNRLPRWFRASLDGLEERQLLATFTVTNTADSGTGSLRNAIASANSTAGADATVFDDSFNSPRTITLTSGQLTITNDLTITGPGAANLTVSGNNASRVFNVDDGNFGTVRTVRIEGLTVTAGQFAGSGGGVHNAEGLPWPGSPYPEQRRRERRRGL